tara:strand:+ start:322 stop:885 length:564 start_codon:yes stop_codon:yes gene_type:complete
MSTQDSAPDADPGGPMDRIDRVFGHLNAGIAFVAAVVLALFALSIAGDLAARRLGLGNLPWLYEVIEYSLFITVFLASPWVLREGAHVRVDLLLTALPRAAAVRLERAINLLGASVCGVLCYFGWQAGLAAFVDGSRQYKTLIISDWWLMSIFTVALLLIAIEFLLRIRRAGDALKAIDDPTEKTGF